MDIERRCINCGEIIGDFESAIKEPRWYQSPNTHIWRHEKCPSKIIIDEHMIQARISEMASEIDSYYKNQEWYQRTQEPVIVIGILTGAMFFMTDLVRKLSIRMELDSIRISTYPKEQAIVKQSKVIHWSLRNLHDAHILLIDDILDTGKTLELIKKYLSWPYPESIKTAVLLRKTLSTPVTTTADFIGFDIPDKFVYGFGLDDNGRHRELPYVAVRS